MLKEGNFLWRDFILKLMLCYTESKIKMPFKPANEDITLEFSEFNDGSVTPL
jgi:hypothetical protein